MSEFDRENQELFSMVNNNPRRTGVLRDVGVIVPLNLAQEFADFEESKKLHGNGLSVALMALTGIACLVAGIAAVL